MADLGLRLMELKIRTGLPTEAANTLAETSLDVSDVAL